MIRRNVFWLFLLSSFCVFSSYTVEAKPNALQSIQADQQSGRINYQTALTYKAYSLFMPEKLPSRYQSAAPAQATHGGLELNEIRQHFALLPQDVRAKVSQVMDRPVLSTSYNTAHFTIHYDLMGSNRVTPAYLDSVKAVVEHCWQKEVDTLGYHPPPHDSNGPDSLYDVYIQNMSTSGYPYLYYGLTTIDNYLTGTSYLIIDNDYQESGFSTKGVKALKVTVAHEFFHAVQDGYIKANPEYYVWWMEINSTWMEDVVYNDINDYYQYLPSWFSSPHKSLMTSDGWHEYGSGIFNHFISKRFGRDIIKEIWESSRVTVSPDNIIDTVLIKHGSSLENEFQIFTVWNYFTGTRADTVRYYPEGAFYPELDPAQFYYHTVQKGAPLESTITTSALEPFSSQYIVVDSLQLMDSARAVFSDIGNSAWGVGLILRDSGNAYIVDYMSMLNKKDGIFDLADSARSRRMVMVVDRVSSDGTARYQYALQHSWPVPEAMALLSSYPNPVKVPQIADKKTYFPFAITKPETDIRLRIFNYQGELVKIIPIRSTFPGTYKSKSDLINRNAFWNLTNDAGREVASGVYYYQLQVGKKDYSGMKKLSVLK
jgi:hypothetical protein